MEKDAKESEGGKNQPKWGNRAFNMVILILLAYGAYEYLEQKRKDTIPADQLFATQPLGQGVQVMDSRDPRIEQLYQQRSYDYTKSLMPVSRPGVRVTQLEAGSGPAALCGQVATFRRYDGDNTGEPETLRIGDISQPLGLSLGLKGMRVGEVRQMMIPAPLFKENATKDDKELQIVKAELLSLSPETDYNEQRLRRFLIQAGSGTQLRCGDMAIAHIAVWDSNGELLFDSKADNGLPIWFEIGMGHVPFGLETGALSMSAGGAYTIIMPQNMREPLHPAENAPVPPTSLAVRAWPAELVLPKDRAVILDITMPAKIPHITQPASPLTAQ